MAAAEQRYKEAHAWLDRLGASCAEFDGLNGQLCDSHVRLVGRFKALAAERDALRRDVRRLQQQQQGQQQGRKQDAEEEAGDVRREDDQGMEPFGSPDVCAGQVRRCGRGGRVWRAESGVRGAREGAPREAARWRPLLSAH